MVVMMHDDDDEDGACDETGSGLTMMMTIPILILMPGISGLPLFGNSSDAMQPNLFRHVFCFLLRKPFPGLKTDAQPATLTPLNPGLPTRRH